MLTRARLPISKVEDEEERAAQSAAVSRDGFILFWRRPTTAREIEKSALLFSDPTGSDKVDDGGGGGDDIELLCRRVHSASRN